MATPTPNYTVLHETTSWEIMFYLWHRMGIQSNVLVSGRYEGDDLTKSAILAALRTVVLSHSALWHVWVQRPSPTKKGHHVLDKAVLNSIDVEALVEVIEDDGQGLSPAFLEKYHNEWLWMADQPDKPWWKLVVKGRDVVFVYHHVVGDGMSGYVFHREFLDALNHLPPSTTQAEETEEEGYILRRADKEWYVPADPIRLWKGKYNILELIGVTLYWIIIRAWYGDSYIYGSLPYPKPVAARKDVSVAARPEDRTVGRFISHRIPREKMARILTACREHDVTFTPLLMTMFTVVLSSEFYPSAKLGITRYANDMRPRLPMDKVGGGTRNGVIFNGASGGQHAHRDLSAYRRVIPFVEGADPKVPTVRDAALVPDALWPLVKSYRVTMMNHIYGQAARVWTSMLILPTTFEGFINQCWDSMHRTLSPSIFISNLGPFSAAPVTGEPEKGGPKTWHITDVQFCVGPTNRYVGSSGVGLSVAGLKGGDTVIHGSYQEGAMTKEEAEDTLERLMARIYELVGI